MSRLAIHLKVDEAIEWNRRAAQTFDTHALPLTSRVTPTPCESYPFASFQTIWPALQWPGAPLSLVGPAVSTLNESKSLLQSSASPKNPAQLVKRQAVSGHPRPGAHDATITSIVSGV